MTPKERKKWKADLKNRLAVLKISPQVQKILFSIATEVESIYRDSIKYLTKEHYKLKQDIAMMSGVGSKKKVKSNKRKAK